jgi:hypothetical protein
VHIVSPPTQPELLQFPPLHTWPPEQTRPHWPQLLLSDGTHPLVQEIWPVPQTHEPD